VIGLTQRFKKLCVTINVSNFLAVLNVSDMAELGKKQIPFSTLQYITSASFDATSKYHAHSRPIL